MISSVGRALLLLLRRCCAALCCWRCCAALLLCSRRSTHSSWLCFASSVGAPKTREFTEAELQALSKFSMVTIEKFECEKCGPDCGESCKVDQEQEAKLVYAAEKNNTEQQPKFTTCCARLFPILACPCAV